MAININREVEDTFYRYKMPRLATKVEGKGNGIKTVIVNVTDIARALYRKPIYLTKFFGCELGAQVYVDDKNERYIVNGAHDATKLQELLDGFIKKFVLCQSCGNPETTMHVNKKAGPVTTVCKACGNQGQLDQTHRLTQYIVKNPPDPEPVVTKTKSKKSKITKSDTVSEGNDVSVSGTEENNHESPNNNVSENEGDDDDWLDDTTEEAQKRRLDALSAMAKSLALCDSVEKDYTQRADVFFKHLSKFHEEGSVLSRSDEIKKQRDQLNLGPKGVLVLAEVLLNEPSTILNDIKTFTPVFLLFTSGDRKAQHYLWGAVEKLIDRHALLPKSCHLLKLLYDCDIIEEDVIMSWWDKGPSKKFVSRELSAKILKQCTPMVEWLRDAEEEGSDEEVEDSEQCSEQSNGVHATESEEELVDIDAI